MRITAVINSLYGGGAERTLLTLSKAFQQIGFQVTIVTFTGEDIPPEKLKGCRHISLESKVKYSGSWARLPALCWSLRQTILATNPTLVISFMDQANILSILALFSTKIPVYVCERVYPAYSSLMTFSNRRAVQLFFRLVRNLVYLKATRIVLQSQRMREYFPTYLQKGIIVIPNPITEPPIGGDVPTIERPSIVAVGRLVEQKRFDLLIDAFDTVSKKFPDWHLQIAGTGPLASQLKAHADRVTASKRIHLLGQQTNIAGLLGQGEIFVLSSDYEGFPVALGEALYCGLPVIASDCLTGPSELLGESQSGLLFSPGNLGQLSSHLEKLMGSAELRNELGKRARTRAQDFSLQSIVADWLEIITLDNKIR